MIGKDLIDSEDPKHTQFCREMAFVMICTLFRDDISIQLLEYPIPPRPARARHKNRQVPISRSAIIDPLVSNFFNKKLNNPPPKKI